MLPSNGVLLCGIDLDAGSVVVMCPLRMPIISLFLISLLIGCSAEEPNSRSTSDPPPMPFEENSFLEGPCGSKSQYIGFEKVLSNNDIPYRIEEYKGTTFICWSEEHSPWVDKIAEDLYGKDPGPYNFSLGSPEKMNQFEEVLLDKNINYTRNIYFSVDIIGWSKKDNEAVKAILKETFNVDIDQFKSTNTSGT